MCETHQSITLYICNFNLMPMVLSSADSGVPSEVLHALFMPCCSLQCETTRAFIHLRQVLTLRHSLDRGTSYSEGVSGRRLEEREEHIQHFMGLKWMVSEWHSISCSCLPLISLTNTQNCDYIIQSHLAIDCMHSSCRV